MQKGMVGFLEERFIDFQANSGRKPKIRLGSLPGLIRMQRTYPV